MANWKIELKAPHGLVPLIEEIIYGLNEDGFPTLSDFEIEEDNDNRLMEAFFAQKPDIDLLQKRLNDIIPSFDLRQSDLSLEEVEDKDWVSESQKMLQPVDAGLFFVYGSHDSDKVPTDRLSLLVEAGQAFGTGQHETTYGCLLAISDLAEELSGDKAPKTALDLGCGSGLLALAMSKVWPITIVASDIDPIATDTTILNVHANQTTLVAPTSQEPGLAVLTSDGFGDPLLSNAGPYDVIVANILAKPLQDMAPDIVANLAKDGFLILSGLLATQEDAVCAAYAKEGMALVKRYPKGDWHSLMLRHEKP